MLLMCVNRLLCYCGCRRFGLLVFFGLVNFGGSLQAEVLRVAISNPENVDPLDAKYYYEQLLRLALEKTRKTDGDFVIVYNPHDGGTERTRAMLVANMGIDVIWGSVTKERENKMRVVPVNLLKNLNNYRVLLIAKGDQGTFDKIKTLDDFRALRAGSGLHWTDTEILKENGIEAITSAHYLGLYKMLAARRFHYVTRGLHDFDFDLSRYRYLGIDLESHLMLHYETPTQYSFFVRQNDADLANRIERGLLKAQKDGSFDALFYQIPSFNQGMLMMKQANRTLIELKNSAEK
jgi:hypothetical protein